MEELLLPESKDTGMVGQPLRRGFRDQVCTSTCQASPSPSIRPGLCLTQRATSNTPNAPHSQGLEKNDGEKQRVKEPDRG